MSNSPHSPKPRLTQTAKTGGCGCKIAPRRLNNLLHRAGILPPTARPDSLIAGAENADDAAVWQIAEDCALVATADFFAPMVDVPHDFGRIAAANAISDIYAMGAQPLLALALAAMPQSLVSEEDIAAIWAGGAQCCQDAGIIIAGGHSIDAAEPLYGLAVIGRAHPARILTNGGARPGDIIILGKPLGVGLMSVAHRNDKLQPADYRAMVDGITSLNKAGPPIAQISGAHAMTDVTGFGLLGHLLEICRASKCRATLHFADIPIFTCARQLAKNGDCTGASKRNWESYAAHISGMPLAEWQRTLLTDPQTGGGLLISCTPAASEKILAALTENGNTQAKIIGTIDTGADIIVRE